MLVMTRSKVFLAVLFVCAPAFAQSISGTVYDDPPALGLRNQFYPVSGASVLLYRDGETQPAAKTGTDAQGRYAFGGLAAGEYWVAVDSKTIGGGARVWAEQTFGSAGARCAQTDGTTRTNYFEGACVGGRTPASDDASSLATSEHVAKVKSGTNNVDFAFSFNVITSIEDSSTAKIQGSLRQFVDNANALPKPNAMRFVPLTRPTPHTNPSLGIPPRWWTITMKGALPKLTDPGTSIDGTAHNILSTASAIDVNQGRIGEKPTVSKGQPDDTPREEKPELEIILAGDEGIVCDTPCVIRSLALRGVPNPIVTHADAMLEQVVIGADANAEDFAIPHGNVGLQIEGGTTTARFVYIAVQDQAGIAVAASGARLDGDRLVITRCGTPGAGAAIALFTDGSSIRHSNIFANEGAGVLIGSPDGSQPGHGNVVEESVISNNLAGVVFSPGSSRNIVAKSQITWNRVGGVVATAYSTNPPQQNRISANIFDENGGRPIAMNEEEKKGIDMLSAARGNCDRIDAVANHGIPAPVITNVRPFSEGSKPMVTISGRACPDETVEIYQSYVTSEIRKAKEHTRLIRRTEKGETITIEQQQLDAYPSIGEFNYMATTTTGADGTFEVSVAVPQIITARRSQNVADIVITNEDALRGSDSDRAYSALAIDLLGNTSEMGERRRVEINARR
jgi:hypothetical protein